MLPSSGAVNRLPSCSLFTLFVLSLAGCQSAAVKTRLLPGAGANEGGISYYLPMRYAKVTFERTKVDSKAIEAVTKANGSLKEQNAALKAAQAAVAAQQGYLTALKQKGFAEPAEPYKTGLGELIKAELEVVAKKKAVGVAEAELVAADTSRKQYAEAQPMCGWVDSIKVTLEDPVPDPSARYELMPLHSAARADHFKIGTTPSGLLKSADAELKDQTGEILINIAKSIAAPARPSMSNARKPATAGAAATCDQLDWQPRSLVFMINPARDSEWMQVSTEINKAANVGPSSAGGATPALNFNYALALASSNPPAGASRGSQSGEVGLYYRRERPLLMAVTMDSKPIGGFVLVVPNDAPIDSFNVQATAFVTNDYKIAFENGMLVGVDQTQPSQLLEVVSLPWKIAKETVGIVTELIKLRVDYSSNNTSVVEQQVKLTEQMKALIEAQQALESARHQKNEAESTDGTTEPDGGA
jgi:hypothetical protein